MKKFGQETHRDAKSNNADYLINTYMSNSSSDEELEEEKINKEIQIFKNSNNYL